jgi:hypothetical protein
VARGKGGNVNWRGVGRGAMVVGGRLGSGVLVLAAGSWQLVVLGLGAMWICTSCSLGERGGSC